MAIVSVLNDKIQYQHSAVAKNTKGSFS